ncbi:hypothetical protein F6R98_08445 [Candidatus Methylospira mobilis]|uniref:Uncharacterized protein n=1 Tax=Candidatus Methylospira mobilis TaxID=1808979 RepID=A0A5Q0BKK0_9GAMM|nr:hypothetical protein [Candidatus Methylospira mobilis]QFY42648.1 hypothetical protein F6R98_08445 [Candidatus Methylospira mobilis]
MTTPVFSDALDQSITAAIDQRMGKLLERHWNQPGSPPPEQDSTAMKWMAAILAPDFSSAEEPVEEKQQEPATHATPYPAPQK